MTRMGMNNFWFSRAEYVLLFRQQLHISHALVIEPCENLVLNTKVGFAKMGLLFDVR